MQTTASDTSTNIKKGKGGKVSPSLHVDEDMMAELILTNNFANKANGLKKQQQQLKKQPNKTDRGEPLELHAIYPVVNACITNLVYL